MKKECPLCGGEGIRHSDYTDFFSKRQYIQCVSCGARTSEMDAFYASDAADAAEKEWNSGHVFKQEDKS